LGNLRELGGGLQVTWRGKGLGIIKVPLGSKDEEVKEGNAHKGGKGGLGERIGNSDWGFSIGRGFLLEKE